MGRFLEPMNAVLSNQYYDSMQVKMSLLRSRDGDGDGDDDDDDGTY